MSSTSDQFPYLIVTPSVNIILYCRRLNVIYVTRSSTDRTKYRRNGGSFFVRYAGLVPEITEVKLKVIHLKPYQIENSQGRIKGLWALKFIQFLRPSFERNQKKNKINTKLGTKVNMYL